MYWEGYMEIHPLGSVTHLAQSVARLVFSHFRKAYAATGVHNVEGVRRALELNAEVFVATVHGQLAGTVTLEQNDMDTRRLLTPWVADLVVIPAMRRRGVGSALLDHVATRAREQGVQTLYAWTSTEGFFRSHQFRFVERVEHLGSVVTVMGLDFYVRSSQRDEEGAVHPEGVQLEGGCRGEGGLEE